MEEDEYSTGPERKKSKFQVKCHHCGKIGHKIAECRSRLQRGQNAKGNNKNGSSNSGVKDRSNIRCFKCNEMGHYATSCSKIRSSEEKIYEKHVDICTVAPPRGIINLSGESVPFCFDSGAECSLIKESVADKI